MREPTYSDAWFETFGRPDEAQTAREVAFLLDVLPAPPTSVLDVPCGFGRHARALSEQGYQVTGIEKNPAVAAEARLGGVEVYELDMRRLRDLQGSFDAVICMWASFGWFDDATNADVFEQMAEKTQPGGVLVLDVYDQAWFRAHQGQHVIERNGRVAHGHRNVAGTRLHTTLDYEDGSHDVFEWRLYEPDELSVLGAELGFVCDVMCAEFDLEAKPVGDTPRMQLVFRRH